jgi:hypothetical protein
MQPETYLAGLFNRHAFLYERKAYSYYVGVTPTQAQENVKEIWNWLEAAFRDRPHGVEEALVLFWPEKDGKSVWTHSRFGGYGVAPASRQESAGETSEPATYFQKWLAVGGPTDADRHSIGHFVVVFYLLHEKRGKKQEELRNLDEFLRVPTVRVTATKDYCKVDERPWDVSEYLEGLSRELLAVGDRYYQRMAVGFRCRGPDYAEEVHKRARDIVVSFLTHWGTTLEIHMEGVRRAREMAMAWAHEIGNFIKFMSEDYLQKYPHLYRTAQQYIEIVTMTAGKSDTVPSMLRGLLRGKIRDRMRAALMTAGELAVLRTYRGDPENDAVKERDRYEQTVEQYVKRFHVKEGLDKELVLNGNRESTYAVIAFGQLLLASLYNAATHCDQNELITIEMSRDWISIKNPCPNPSMTMAVNGTKETLRQAYRALWNGEPPHGFQDFFFGPKDDAWIAEGPLPEELWRKK